MTKIEIKGTIISNNLQRIYDWMEIEATSPSKVINALPQDGGDVEIYISSGGGDVFAGSEIFTALKEYKGNVTVKIVGLAASAASVVAMGAQKILMSPTAQMMIHNVSTSINGDYRDFEHAAETLKSANQSIINAYKTRLNKSDEELQEMMDKESWFNANDALAHGFIDGILFDDKDQIGGQFVANHGSVILSDEVIAKVSKLMENKKHQEAKQHNEMAQAKLKLLKLRGESNGN